MTATSNGSTLADVVDQLAIRDLISSYARHADRGDPAGQAAVFAEDGQVRLFTSSAASVPTQTITGRDALSGIFADLIARYDTTTYLNGQSVIEVDGDTASGETYCMAHHLLLRGGQRQLLIMAIRYLDQFVRTSDGWRISRRDLVFDWTDGRPSNPQT